MMMMMIIIITTQGNKTLLHDWQKELCQTFVETSGHVRLERVNKWPNSDNNNNNNSVAVVLTTVHKKNKNKDT
jgi:hypothetical protein